MRSSLARRGRFPRAPAVRSDERPAGDARCGATQHADFTPSTTPAPSRSVGLERPQHVAWASHSGASPARTFLMTRCGPNVNGDWRGAGGIERGPARSTTATRHAPAKSESACVSLWHPTTTSSPKGQLLAGGAASTARVVTVSSHRTTGASRRAHRAPAPPFVSVVIEPRRPHASSRSRGTASDGEADWTRPTCSTCTHIRLHRLRQDHPCGASGRM